MIEQLSEQLIRANDIAIEQLRIALPGRVYTPEDEGYDAARAGYALLDQPSPDIIVFVEDKDDVVTAVNVARENNLSVGVQATGHNFGFPFQGGLRINTSRMQGFSINPERQIARVEAGVRWGTVVQAAQEYGLAPLNGSSPTVGVVGYSLFGGFGWMLRKYGAAVDSVVAIEVVTADGQFRRVSATEEPDLFWALRGASGNFGIVTAIEFKLYPVSQIYGGAIFYDIEHAAEVLTAYSKWVATQPEEMTTSIVIMRLPPLPDLPPFLAGKAVISVRGAFIGSEIGGQHLLAPMLSLKGIIANTFRMMPYSENGSIANDPVDPIPAYRKTAMLKGLSPAVIETIVRLAGPQASAPVMMFEIRHIRGAMSRVPDDACAFSQRHAPFIMQTINLIMGPEQGVVVKRNTQTIADAMAPFTTGGVLPSWLGDGDYGHERMRAGFSEAHYKRLTELKRHYDPTNMFCQNHNIKPAE